MRAFPAGSVRRLAGAARRLAAGVALGLGLAASAAGSAVAQDGLAALARIDPGRVGAEPAGRGGVALTLGLSQPVPWRLRVLDAPPRLLLEARTVDWTGLPDGFGAGPAPLRGATPAAASEGWSRLVLTLDGPFLVERAGMAVDAADGTALLSLRLARAPREAFALALAPGSAPGTDAAPRALPESLLPGTALPDTAPPPAGGARRPVIVLDPGHGGIDPGAERAGLREADLMLSFARLLREALLRTGQFDVVLTREADVFVSLEGRIRIAREAGADAFLSLHADALEGGGAAGATVYTLSDTASDEAAALLAQRHDRADLLAGVDLSGTDDIVAGVLMALARTETQPRTDLLAGLVASAIGDAGLRMHPRPLQSAAFSVLKAPDIPSVLVELGFLSSDRDRANLSDAEWQGRMAAALVRALQDWVVADAAEAPLRRQ